MELVCDQPAFERLAAEWDELLEDSEQRVYFLRHAWVRSWWRQLALSSGRLHVVCCRDAEGRLMGVAPLYWRQHRFLGLPYLRELTLLGMGVELKTSECVDIIARRDHEPAIATELAEFLLRRADWDRLCLQQVPAESKLLQHLVGAFGGQARVKQCDRAPYIDTTVGWDAYKHSLGRSMRRNVEYYARRLFKTRRCEFGRATTREQAQQAYESLVRLHQRRWRSVGLPGAFSGSTLRLMLAQAITDEFDTGRVRLWTLRVDGEIQGVLMGLLDNGVLHYFQKGFNPDFARDDIGTALLSLCLRDCFDDPAVRAFDFMGGGAGYKELWARKARATQTCVVARPNLRSSLHAARLRLRDLCADAFRRLAPQWLRAARRDYINGQLARRSAREDRYFDSKVLLPALLYFTNELWPFVEPLFGLDLLMV